MLEENSFDYILLGLITIYALYIIMKNNEPFSDNTTDKTSHTQLYSDKIINKQIFDYVLSELNQTKNPN